MSKRGSTILILLVLFAHTAWGQGKFFTESSLGYVFDNHEFDASSGSYIPSETIHFVRVTHLFGWDFSRDDAFSSRLVFGADMVKQMGTEVAFLRDLVADLPIFYEAAYDDGSQIVRAALGSYPRQFVSGAYSEAMMSEETLETDFNLDGMYFSWQKGDCFTELALDWMGKYGETRKERFQILGYGAWTPSDLFSLGWAGSFYHYAGSVEAPGVVDNHHLQLFAKVDAAPLTGLSELSLKLSAIGCYQNDRKRGDFRTPYGAEAELRAQWKSLGLKNITAYTQDFLPFYGMTDTAGNPYGDMLYRGSKFYRGFYDLAELYWVPKITKKLDAKLSFRFHFAGEGFLGFEQRVSLYFNVLQW